MGCHTHREHGAAGTCRSCTLEFCEECLVYAFGEGKQPYCVDCAVTASSKSGWDDRRRPDRTTAAGVVDLRSSDVTR